VKKVILLDKRAVKELHKFPRTVQLKFRALFNILESEGVLEEPFAKKLTGKSGLFEIRVKYQGQWRALYAYMKQRQIIILPAFRKRTQKTPIQELRKAEQRLLNY
jgi:phage-related protein